MSGKAAAVVRCLRGKLTHGGSSCFTENTVNNIKKRGTFLGTRKYLVYVWIVLSDKV